MKTVRIIGAGMSGLLTAYYLTEKGIGVEIHEREADVGGKIRTVHGVHGLLETAANAILSDFEVEAVAKKIGLDLTPTQPSARRRWILRGFKLRRWPLGFAASFRLLFFLILKKWFPETVKPKPFETLEVWGKRTLGLEATACLLAPACLGIFGVGPSELSASLIYYYFFTSRGNQELPPSQFKGSVAPVKGMGDFPVRLKFYLQNKGVRFVFSQSEVQADKSFNATVVATDAMSARSILRKLGDPRAGLLEKLPMVDLVSVNVMYEKGLRPGQRGFGVLFPPTELVEPLGVLFNSSIFANRSRKAWSETWIFGGRAPWRRTKDAHNHFFNDIKDLRQKLFAQTAEPLEHRVNVWPNAIPLYGIELETILSGLGTGPEGIYLMGNYLGEIGLNRLFHRAKKLARDISKL